MKLFQQMLVAGASLSLLAPIAAQASDVVNLEEMKSYSRSTIKKSSRLDSKTFINEVSEDIANLKGRVDGLEAQQNNFEAGAFSSTTSMDGKAAFWIGAIDGATKVSSANNESVSTGYIYSMNLNTSFTGEDSLDISLDAGNSPTSSGSSTSPLAEFDLNATGDALQVDGVSYTFPVSDSITAIVGDNTDGSALFTTACVYGGPSNTLDDCGNVNAGITNGGTAFGASYDFGNGFSAAVGFAGAETGIMTKETTDAYGFNAAYTADSYGVSVTYGFIETGTNGVNENTYTAVNGYYSFDSGLSISAGYEIGDIGGAVATEDESINYFVGLNGEVGPGELGAALGTSGGQLENQTEELMYEAYYSYPVNDGMTITPLVYIKEQAASTTPDQTGIMVKTSFSF